MMSESLAVPTDCYKVVVATSRDRFYVSQNHFFFPELGNEFGPDVFCILLMFSRGNPSYDHSVFWHGGCGSHEIFLRHFSGNHAGLSVCVVSRFCPGWTFFKVQPFDVRV